MAQPGTPLTDGQLANFIAALTKAGILIAPQIGVEQVLRLSKNNDQLLQAKLAEALSHPVLPCKPRQVDLEVRWQIAEEFSRECEELLRSLDTDKKQFEITGFGQKLFDLARSLPRETVKTEYTLCTPYQLGVRHDEYYHQLISWILAHHRLQLCTKLAGPIICAITPYGAAQPSLIVAMQPLVYRRNIELAFKLGCNGDKRVLDARPVRNLVISPHDKLLFALPSR